MWTSFARGGMALAVLTFMMWVLTKILDPILSMANSGPHADASSVQRIGGYFSALTLDNLVLVAGVAVGIFLLGRAAVERRVGP